jgi:hypothetical protein
MAVPHSLVENALRVPIFSGLKVIPHPIDPTLAAALFVEANAWAATAVVPHDHPELHAILYLLGLVEIPSYNACLIASVYGTDPQFPVVEAFVRSWVCHAAMSRH